MSTPSVPHTKGKHGQSSSRSNPRANVPPTSVAAARDLSTNQRANVPPPGVASARDLSAMAPQPSQINTRPLSTPFTLEVTISLFVPKEPSISDLLRVARETRVIGAALSIVSIVSCEGGGVRMPLKSLSHTITTPYFPYTTSHHSLLPTLG